MTDQDAAKTTGRMEVRDMTEADLQRVFDAMPPWAVAQGRLVRAGLMEAFGLEATLSEVERGRIVVAVVRRLYKRHTLIRARMLEAVEAAVQVGAGLAVDIDFARMEIDEAGPGEPRVRLHVRGRD